MSFDNNRKINLPYGASLISNATTAVCVLFRSTYLKCVARWTCLALVGSLFMYSGTVSSSSPLNQIVFFIDLWKTLAWALMISITALENTKSSFLINEHLDQASQHAEWIAFCFSIWSYLSTSKVMLLRFYSLTLWYDWLSGWVFPFISLYFNFPSFLHVFVFKGKQANYETAIFMFPCLVETSPCSFWLFYSLVISKNIV